MRGVPSNTERHRRWLQRLLVGCAVTLCSATEVQALVAGDVDGDSNLRATDLQMVINTALGFQGTGLPDQNYDGRTDSIDIQLVILGLLGLSIDRDGDGLSDAAEAVLGSDPDKTDSDGDGTDDGDEVAAGRDPNVIDLLNTDFRGAFALDDGSPLSELSAVLSSESAEQDGAIVSGDDGFFTIPLDIKADAESAQVQVDLPGKTGNIFDFPIEPGEQNDIGVMTPSGLHPQYTVFTGRVVDSDSTAVPSATVRASIGGGSTSDVDGNFVLGVIPEAPLPPGIAVISHATVESVSVRGTKAGISATPFGSTEVGDIALGPFGPELFPTAISKIPLADDGFRHKVALGDLNGDGHEDFAALTRGDIIKTFLGQGDGTFVPSTSFIPKGNNPTYMAIADFDGDTANDILVLDKYFGVYPYFNTGNGYVNGENEVYAPRDVARYVVSGFINGDAFPDLLVSDDSVGARVLLNDGAGGFTTGAEFTNDGTGGFGRGAIADLNQDGKADVLFVPVGGGSLHFYAGDGGGGFASAVAISSVLGIRAMAVGDVDSDGWADVVTMSRNGRFSTHFYDGDGGFEKGTNGGSFLTNSSYELRLGDFDGDGFVDCVATALEGYFAIVFGRGDGVFVSDGRFEGTGFELEVGDFNGNDLADVLVASNDDGALIGVDLTDNQTPVGMGPLHILTEDFDGDGINDLLTTNGFGGNVSLLRGIGDGTYADHVDVPVNDAEHKAPWVSIPSDRNGDDLLDLFIADVVVGEMPVLLNTGSSFQQGESVLLEDVGITMTNGDFNGDEVEDFAVARQRVQYATSGTKALRILTGNEDYSISIGQSIALDNNLVSIETGNFDGDTHLDLIATRETTDDVQIFRGIGDGTFESYIVIPTPEDGITYAAAGDLDGDGLDDFVTTHSGPGADGRVEAYLNRGSANFEQTMHTRSRRGPWFALIDDLDGDAILDILTADTTGSGFRVFLGNGDGTFEGPWAFTTGGHPTWLVLYDANRDGLNDVVTANRDWNSVTVSLQR